MHLAASSGIQSVFETAIPGALRYSIKSHYGSQGIVVLPIVLQHLQVVLLFQILASPVTNGYKMQSIQVERFNDERVQNLRQLANLVDNCK